MNLKTGRKNSRTKDRRATTLEEIAKMKLRRETNHGFCSTEGAATAQKKKRQTVTQRSTWGKGVHIVTSKKSKRVPFHKFLQPASGA